MSAVEGRLSSGNAELKLQSSSAEAPFDAWGFTLPEPGGGCWGLDEAKSNIDGGAVLLGCCDGEEELCCRALDDSIANGSEACELEAAACSWRMDGVFVCEATLGLVKGGNAS